MEPREEYEPIIIDLQKSQAVRQPKAYFFLFIVSALMFAVLMISAAVYFRRPPVNNNSTTQPPVVRVTPVAEKPTPVPVTPTPVPTPILTPTPRPVASVVEPKGRLTLYSYPEHAEVVINGNVLGYTPLENYELAPGTYTVKFSYEGQISQQQITITAGNVTKHIYRFPGFSSIKVETTSSGCDITVNGKLVGTSPLVVEGLSPGTYTIVAKKVGFATTEKTVNLGKSEHLDLFITIKRLGSTRRPTSERTIRPVHPSERIRENTP
jgi:hypothetical protein